MKLSDSEIIFCDNHLLVASKPSGIPTQPAPTQDLSLETLAKQWVKETYKKPGNVFLHAIHRLDKPVSGLVLFARTSKALSRLNEQQRNMEIQRIYLAEVEGSLPIQTGQLDHYLVHASHQAVVSNSKNPEAKHARLTYQVLEGCGMSSVVKIELHTGRYHQIRAQFSAIGHPVYGDRRYGAKTGNESEIRLHCFQLQLAHPITKELLSFQSFPPFFSQYNC